MTYSDAAFVTAIRTCACDLCLPERVDNVIPILTDGQCYIRSLDDTIPDPDPEPKERWLPAQEPGGPYNGSYDDHDAMWSLPEAVSLGIRVGKRNKEAA